MPNFNEPVLNIAHRGASAVAPENTLAAFELAQQLGADGVELDVQFSKDHQVVVIHDDTLSRTTDGAGKVLSHTLSELQSLDAGSWFSKEFGGERIPTLEQVLAFAAGRLLLNIEIKKCRDSAKLAQAVIDLIEPYDPEQFIITSFDRRAVEHVKTVKPSLPTGLLFTRLTHACLQGKHDFIVPHWRLIDEKVLQRSADKKIMTWTVDGEEEMLRLMDAGVGRIITNRPDTFKKIIIKRKIALTMN